MIAGCRRPTDLEETESLLAVKLDVTRPDHCRAAVARAVELHGRLDVVANVAGTGLVGAVEETPSELARALFEVNFWGAANVALAALPVLRAQGRGHLLQVSSLSGRISAPGVGYYAASKFALEGLSEALHAELRPLGIRVTIAEPGGVRTDWAGSSLWKTEPSAAYAETAGATREVLERVDGRQPSSSEDVAAALLALVADPDPPLRAPVTADAVERIGARLEAEAQALARWRGAPGAAGPGD